jgi:hypothetical protein
MRFWEQSLEEAVRSEEEDNCIEHESAPGAEEVQVKKSCYREREEQWVFF